MMEILLTCTQKKRAEVKKKAQYKRALVGLKKLLGSKERKDLMPKVHVVLAELGFHTLYLTRRGLVEEEYSSQTGIDGTRESHDSSWTRKPSLEIVEEYDLSLAKLRQVLRKLKA